MPHRLSNIHIRTEEVDKSLGYKVWRLTLEGLPIVNPGCSIGVDPGRNFGVATICEDGSAEMIYGTFPKEEKQWKYGLWAFDYIRKISVYLVRNAVVEGAAYNVFKGKGNINPGQVGLAEVRFGFILGLREVGVTPEVVPPATIRKGVYGYGRSTEQDIWPGLNKNGGSALACALYAAGYRHPEDTDS